MQKRGLSPVIATVLLISIVLVLAVIIFLWARSYLGETTQKDLGGGPEPIENFCDDIRFDVEVFENASYVYAAAVNRGDVPLYGLSIQKKSGGSLKLSGKFEGGEKVIKSGESSIIILKDNSNLRNNPPDLDAGDVVRVLPILLGEKGTAQEEYICGSEFGKEITIVRE
ncbi:hypothetical protein J4461_01075 [Candidatus Pacearchaeota archaeon]|nr:hypothetical protein [Candidatus Pacearchaeota archaeon]